MNVSELSALLRTKKAKIGVIGLGYVGLPICLAAVNAGFGVLGFDIDPQKPEMLRRGQSYLRHIPSKLVTGAMAANLFDVTADMSRLAEPDAILICVPTPISMHLEPDISFIVSTAEAIARQLRPGQLVVLESTTYPGTTDEVLRPLLEKSGLVCGRDFFLAFSPEREDPGNAEFSTSTIPTSARTPRRSCLQAPSRRAGCK